MVVSIGLVWPSLRQIHAADHVVDVEQRPCRLISAGATRIDLEAEGPRHRGAALQLLEPLGVGGDREAAALQEAGRLAGLGLERRHRGCVVYCASRVRFGGRAQLADEPGRVPGGAAGQPLALEQHDVAPAELGQVIGDRGADDAAADDDDARMGGQGRGHSACLSGAKSQVRLIPGGAAKNDGPATLAQKKDFE